MKRYLGAVLAVTVLGGGATTGPSAAAEPSPALMALLDTCKISTDGPARDARIAACTQLIRTPPGPGPLSYALTVRGALLGQTGECERALADLNSAVTVAPGAKEALYWRALTRTLCGGDAQETLTDLETVLRLDPQFQQAYRLRGALYLSRGRMDEAQTDLDKAIALAANDAVAQTDRGALELMRGDPAAALPFADAAISADANLASAHLLRAQALLGMRRLDEARSSLDRAIALDERNSDAFYRRAEVRLQTRDLRGAYEDVQKALALKPDNVAYRSLRGQIAFLAQRLEPALADFNAVLATRPTDLNALSGRAEIFMRRNRFAEAIRDFDAAAANDRPGARPPGYFDAKRCWARAVGGLELDVAKTLCDTALAANQGAPFTQLSLGLVALRQNRFQDAWIAFDKASKLGPDVAAYIFLRGVAAVKLGQTESGQADIARAKGLSPSIASTYATYGITP